MNWYYVEQGKQAGPVSDEQIEGMFQSGNIKSDTLVWHEGMTDWVPYGEAKGLAADAGAPGGIARPEAVCSECGKIFPEDETIRYGNARVCAACKPLFLQKLQEGAMLNTGEMRYAGFGVRFAAKFLDGLIIGVPFMIVFFVVVISTTHTGEPQAMNLWPLLIRAIFFMAIIGYEIFFIGKYGATLGKMACKIHVVTSNGDKVSYGRATGRAFAERLSAIVCYIGYIIVAFDNPQKRALHDHICNTRVVYK